MAEYYEAEKGEKPFQEWLDGLKDITGRAKIHVRIDGARLGNLGDNRAVGEGCCSAVINQISQKTLNRQKHTGRITKCCGLETYDRAGIEGRLNSICCPLSSAPWIDTLTTVSSALTVDIKVKKRTNIIREETDFDIKIRTPENTLKV